MEKGASTYMHSACKVESWRDAAGKHREHSLVVRDDPEGCGRLGREGKYVCVCVCVYTCVVMADSRFRTPETSTTLQSHFPPNKTQIKKEY